jgi:hypothetical protein
MEIRGLMESADLYATPNRGGERMATLPPGTVLELGPIQHNGGEAWIEVILLDRRRGFLLGTVQVGQGVPAPPDNLRPRILGTLLLGCGLATVCLWMVLNVFSCSVTTPLDYKGQAVQTLADRHGVAKDRIQDLEVVVQNPKGGVVSVRIDYGDVPDFALFCFTNLDGKRVSDVYAFKAQPEKPFTRDEIMAFAKEQKLFD